MFASLIGIRESIEVLLSTGADVTLQDNVCKIYDLNEE